SSSAFPSKWAGEPASTSGRYDLRLSEVFPEPAFVVVSCDVREHKVTSSRTVFVRRTVFPPNAKPFVLPLIEIAHRRLLPGKNLMNFSEFAASVGPIVSRPSGNAHTISSGARTGTPSLFARSWRNRWVGCHCRMRAIEFLAH